MSEGVRTFEVPSASSAGTTYTVTLNHAGGAMFCTCPAGRNQRDCKHKKWVEADPSKFRETTTASGSSTDTSTTSSTNSTLAIKPLPMLAKPFSGFVAGKMVVEEKFDGHRCLVRVDKGQITAWSRTGKDCIAKLSVKMLTTLKSFPDCVLDGEICATSGGRSYNVSHLTKALNTFVVFDILELMGKDITSWKWKDRNYALVTIFDKIPTQNVKPAQVWAPKDEDELMELVNEIWTRSGEGVIVKRIDSPYHVGKRSDAFMKIKELQSEILEIIGFVASSGEKIDRGPWATTVLRDAQGVVTVVKTLDDETLAKGDRAWRAAASPEPSTTMMRCGAKNLHVNVAHPWVGRQLRIEYHQKTEDGSYRHPRWDRFEDE